MYIVLKHVPNSRYPLYSIFSIFIIEFRPDFAMLIHADQQPAAATACMLAAVYRTATGHTSTKFSRGTLYVYSACTVYLTST